MRFRLILRLGLLMILGRGVIWMIRMRIGDLSSILNSLLIWSI